MLQLAQPKDREAVNRLALQVHALHVAWRPDIFSMTDELFPEEKFLCAIAIRELFVAKLEDQVVGYAVLQIKDYDWPGVVRRKVMVVEQVCVEEALRGHGIGTVMMEDVHSLAKAFGCTDLQLSAYPQNDEAIGFYQKCGFTIRCISMQRKV